MESSTNGHPPSPDWIRRLAAALVGNEEALVETALEWLRRTRGIRRAELVPAAVLAALVETASGPALVLTRRREDLPQHSGQVALPGGMVDRADVSVEAAALREADEEIGLHPARVRVLGRLPRYPTVTGYLVTPVVGYVASLPDFSPAPAEVAEVFVVPVEVLLDSSRWVQRVLKYGNEEIRQRELPYERWRIWGVTASVLELLLPPLRAALRG